MFKPFAIKIRFQEPEDAEIFLRGCIVARTNNNSPKFKEMIDAINEQMLEYRKQQLLDAVEARDA